MGMVWKVSVNWWPVAVGSGTLQGLEQIYGCSVGDEAAASELLAQLYFNLRSRGEFKGRGKADSVATLSLTLCGWIRSQYACQWKHRTISGLDRAILQEEIEFCTLRKLRVEEERME